MNDDLISRQAVFDWFCESADIDGCVDLSKNNGSCKKGCRHCIDGKELDEIPTADVRENVHAHWEDWSFLGWDMKTHWSRRCSNCLYEREDDNEEKDTLFCPNCGAVMDERKEDD